VQTQEENRPVSKSSWSTRQPAEISYRIRTDTLEHRPIGNPQHTDNDGAHKTCLRDVNQLNNDSVARLRTIIFLF